ncbi:hypothetical protein LTR72_009473 [Exophiala xenobiotica]|nr:hypothetical protein LTR72_009473 [Exophiala xenobiotica]KAK5291912.1 hypothetical protein LTR14_005461 [Exophiala xenobiotica]KAK5329521.1 hypothetical protein LTR93_001108 [Exophiala xenobiotica]KAK5404217.1 hypothetical protein LTR06_009776 [Exophiala xenobiotica]KAK5494675.1 hypothetical protein LTR55_003062 [Exophiala xenobiotica]
MSGLYLPEEVFQGDLEQTASRINSVLNDIRRAMESDARLGALVKYQLKEKGQNEQLRFAKLLKYEGPDAMTIQLLRSQQGVFGLSSEQVAKTIQRMISAGSRYRNLENRLGYGTCLVLGTTLKESSWCEVLPKSGDKFEMVVAHLRSTPVNTLAQEYSELRHCIINHQLDSLDSLAGTALAPVPMGLQSVNSHSSLTVTGFPVTDYIGSGEIDFNDGMWYLTEGNQGRLRVFRGVK